MKLVPFLSIHLDGLILQDGQQFMQERITREYGEILEQVGPGWAGMEDGKCLGCAGFAFSEPHKAVVWSLLGRDITARNMITIHRAVKSSFDKIDAKRIECITRDIPEQKRWAKMLGMKLETPEGMRGYWFDGATGFMYTKVKDEV